MVAPRRPLGGRIVGVGMLLLGVVLCSVPRAAAAPGHRPSTAPRVSAAARGWVAALACPALTLCHAVGGSATGDGQAGTRAGGGGTFTGEVLPQGTPPMTQISCPSVSICYAAGLHGQMLNPETGVSTLEFLASGDGGASWVSRKVPGAVDLRSDGPPALDCPTVSTCLLSSQATVFVTHDGGDNWASTNLATTGVPGPIGELDSFSCPLPSNCTVVGFVGDSQSTVPLVATTGNGGDSWALRTAPEAAGILSAVSCLSALDCVAVGRSTGGYFDSTDTLDLSIVSVDGGATWTMGGIPPSMTGSLGAMACQGSSRCIAPGVSGETAVADMTNDGGASWVQAPVGGPPVLTSPSAPIGLSCPSPTTCLAEFQIAGLQGSIEAETTDGGTTWTQSSTGFLSPTRGYFEVAADGGVFAFGAPFAGSMAGHTLAAPMVAMGTDRRTGGYWLAGADGGVFAFDAPFLGSMGGLPLNTPVVAMAEDPSGEGYWLVSSDGGIFAFGTAAFHGSMAGRSLYRPIVGMASTPDGAGYYEIAVDGGVFAFGDARFQGTPPDFPPDTTDVNDWVGVAADPWGGYWATSSRGVIQVEAVSPAIADFSGELNNIGSTWMLLNGPVVGLATSPGGLGYLMAAADGGVFAFGDAEFLGSMAGRHLNQPIVGLAAQG